MVLAQKAGINPEVLYSILSKSVGRSFVFETKAVQLMERDFVTRGALELNVKDLGICLQMGKELGVPLYLSSIAREVFATAQAKGYGKEDFCAVTKVYEEVAKTEVRKF
jgi:3-hydroxyisobutyrate dehydrogenase-like beta-hydroxyacid dehydrogenase